MVASGHASGKGRVMEALEAVVVATVTARALLLGLWLFGFVCGVLVGCAAVWIIIRDQVAFTASSTAIEACERLASAYGRAASERSA